MPKEKSKFKGDVFAAMILDRSGSMSSIMDETISGFNEQVDAITEDSPQKGDTKFLLTRFNHGVKIGRIGKIKNAKKLDRNTYIPGGMTAMFDAVGKTIEAIKKRVDDHKNQSYLVVVVSDGLENSSREHTSASVAAVVKDLQETGRWTFVYLGANQDLSQVRQQTGFQQGNMSDFLSTPAGMTRAMDKTVDATRYYMRNRSLNVMSTQAFYNDKPPKDAS